MTRECTDIGSLGEAVDSRRYARDIIEHGVNVTTKPWWRPLPYRIKTHPERERVIPAPKSEASK